MPLHPFKRRNYPPAPAPCVAVIDCYGYSADAMVNLAILRLHRIAARRRMAAAA